MLRRSAPICCCCLSSSISYNRERNTRNALARFLICDFSSWQETTSPVGMCVIRTAEYVVLTDWPPGPDEQKVSIRNSLGSTFTSTSSASGSTATVIADVCTRPCCSVSGTRCTRCTPLSYLSLLYTLLPLTSAITSFSPPTGDSLLDVTSNFQPCDSPYRVYMRKISAAN